MLTMTDDTTNISADAQQPIVVMVKQFPIITLILATAGGIYLYMLGREHARTDWQEALVQAQRRTAS